MEPEIFDTIIIGGGPAGLSAAIYAVRKSLKVLVLCKTLGGQAALSGNVENYLGFTLINGADLAAKFGEEVKRFEGQGLWLKEGVEVTDLQGVENNFTVIAGSQSYRGKTIIIAAGRIPRMLDVPGEKELWGKGVATCATCDAPLYKGKEVVIVGGGNSALDAASSLMKIAVKVTLVNNLEQLRGDSILLGRVTQTANVTVLNNHQVLEIVGKNTVEGLKVKDVKNNQELVIAASGIFIEIGWTPSTTFDQLTEKNERGEIEVDALGKTSVAGIWAAGDVNNLWGEQIIIAAGEGAKTALSVVEYLSKMPHQDSSNIHES